LDLCCGTDRWRVVFGGRMPLRARKRVLLFNPA
jgi:hypothetical protein